MSDSPRTAGARMRRFRCREGGNANPIATEVDAVDFVAPVGIARRRQSRIVTGDGDRCSDDSLTVVVAQHAVERGVCRKNRFGGEDEDWIRCTSIGACTDGDVRKRREVVETLEDDLVLTRRNAETCQRPSVDSVVVSNDSVSDLMVTRTSPRLVPWSLVTVPWAPPESSRRLISTPSTALPTKTVCVCVSQPSAWTSSVYSMPTGSLGRLKAPGTPCVKVVVVTTVSPADTVITAPPRPTPPACTTPVMLPTPTVNSVLSVVLASPAQIGRDHLGSEAAAAGADDITRWSTDAFDAPVAQGPIRCRRCRGVRELTITDGYDCPSEWAVRAADRPRAPSPGTSSTSIGSGAHLAAAI